MVAEAAERLLHIKQNIALVRQVLDGESIEYLTSDKVGRAAVERFFEIVSEASRHIPEEWKNTFGPGVPWRQIANFGNVLRHAYDGIDVHVLWSAYMNDLGPLEEAIDAMLEANPPRGVE